jgi:hypothetical protein
VKRLTTFDTEEAVAMKKLALLSLFGSVALAQALELKLEPIGTINVSGALTVYTIHSNNKTDENEKKTRYDVGSAIISLSKSAEPFGFTLIGGAYATPVVGAALLKNFRIHRPVQPNSRGIRGILSHERAFHSSGKASHHNRL